MLGPACSYRKSWRSIEFPWENKMNICFTHVLPVFLAGTRSYVWEKKKVHALISKNPFPPWWWLWRPTKEPQVLIWRASKCLHLQQVLWLWKDSWNDIIMVFLLMVCLGFVWKYVYFPCSHCLFCEKCVGSFWKNDFFGVHFFNLFFPRMRCTFLGG